MVKINSKSGANQLHNLSDDIVALYLTEETGLPCNVKGYEIGPFESQDPTGARVEKHALRVTFENSTSTRQPYHLVTFGSDDQRCNIILKASEASPIHCRVYAQLNSGPNVWVIEDTSSNGTEYVDEESLRTRVSKKVARGRVAAYGLYRLQIGRNIFSFCSPSIDREKSQRERWFRDLDPILVTREVLRDQLSGLRANYCPVDVVGRGGMGEILRYMETTTGLMIAVKEEEAKDKEADERIRKEIGYMQSLKHPNLVEYIASNPSTNQGIKKWFTAMPLYQGCLCDILPLEIHAIENVMLQLFDGVGYMHRQRVLHKDIKPENILVKGKSRPDVVLADYGICASLNNRTELMSTFRTPGYAAPEVLRMIMQTPAVDVFALGATLFAILEPERFIGSIATVATLKNVAQRPPKVYGGLVQSMMAHDPKERPSLKECFDIMKARQHDWKKWTPLKLMPSIVPYPSGLRRSQRIRKGIVQEHPILDLDILEGRKRKLMPLSGIKQSEKHPGMQQAPRSDFKGWDPRWKPQGRKILIAPIAPTPKPQAPVPAQQINFAAPPPPIPDSPFANLNQGPAPIVAPPARRQASPAAHEPTRTPIRKPDNEIKRKIRRGPERRKVIERFHRIAVQKDKLCRAAGELAAANKTPLNLFRGLHHITAGGLGITAHSLGLIFCDLRAARLALNHIAPSQSKRWGLNTDRRLMYGLKTHKWIYWPMTPEEYEAERLQSKLDFENTSEGRRVRARLE